MDCVPTISVIDVFYVKLLMEDCRQAYVQTNIILYNTKHETDTELNLPCGREKQSQGVTELS